MILITTADWFDLVVKQSVPPRGSEWVRSRLLIVDSNLNQQSKIEEGCAPPRYREVVLTVCHLTLHV